MFTQTSMFSRFSSSSTHTRLAGSLKIVVPRTLNYDRASLRATKSFYIIDTVHVERSERTRLLVIVRFFNNKWFTGCLSYNSHCNHPLVASSCFVHCRGTRVGM